RRAVRGPGAAARPHRPGHVHPRHRAQPRRRARGRGACPRDHAVAVRVQRLLRRAGGPAGQLQRGQRRRQQRRPAARARRDPGRGAGRHRAGRGALQPGRQPGRRADHPDPDHHHLRHRGAAAGELRGQGAAGGGGAAAAVAGVPRQGAGAGAAPGEGGRMSAVSLRALLRGGGVARLWRDPRYASLAVTVSLFVAMSVAGGVLYDGFLRPQVFLNLLIDNSFLLIVAVGMTFVILTGGIDLSVGAVIAFSTVLLASLVQHHGWHPLPAIGAVLVLGTGFGALLGVLIERYRLQPFVVTVGRMILSRAAATPANGVSIGPAYAFLLESARRRFPLGGLSWISAGQPTALLAVHAGALLEPQTRSGRTAYALGGKVQWAHLMG